MNVGKKRRKREKKLMFDVKKKQKVRFETFSIRKKSIIHRIKNSTMSKVGWKRANPRITKVFFSR